MKSLCKNLVNKLIRKKLTLSAAESCTGGLFSSYINSINGSSKVFTLGLITYSNQSKINVLKIPKKIIKKFGSVSAEVCLFMVNNLCKISNTSITISITGIAGPSGGSKKKPVGLVYIGIKKGNKIKIKKFLFNNRGRSYIQKNTVNKSIKLISSIIE